MKENFFDCISLSSLQKLIQNNKQCDKSKGIKNRTWKSALTNVLTSMFRD